MASKRKKKMEENKSNETSHLKAIIDFIPEIWEFLLSSVHCRGPLRCSRKIKYCRRSQFVVLEAKFIRSRKLQETQIKRSMKDANGDREGVFKTCSIFGEFLSKHPFKIHRNTENSTLTKTNNEKRSLRNIKN